MALIKAKYQAVDKPHECSKCGLRFRYPSELRKHETSHLSKDQLPNACTMCEKRFAQKCHLNTHMRTHTGVKDSICFCGKASGDPSEISAHIKRYGKDGHYFIMYMGKPGEDMRHRPKRARLTESEPRRTAKVATRKAAEPVASVSTSAKPTTSPPSVNSDMALTSSGSNPPLSSGSSQPLGSDLDSSLGPGLVTSWGSGSDSSLVSGLHPSLGSGSTPSLFLCSNPSVGYGSGSIPSLGYGPGHLNLSPLPLGPALLHGHGITPPMASCQSAAIDYTSTPVNSNVDSLDGLQSIKDWVEEQRRLGETHAGEVVPQVPAPPTCDAGVAAKLPWDLQIVVDDCVQRINSQAGFADEAFEAGARAAESGEQATGASLFYYVT